MVLWYSIFATALKVEDKINRFLTKLKKSATIDDEVYRRRYVSGSAPGILYGLVKTHKENLPLRPILSAFNTASFQISKYVIPFIEKLSHNQYSLKNSYEFVEHVDNFQITRDMFMVSFDISSLYTNTPVSETIDIVCNRLFESCNTYLGFSRQIFHELLTLCVSNSYFVFGENLFRQIDGLAMGNPLAPVLANIFLCNLESKFAVDCPRTIEPKFYRRYLDDIFAVFNSKSEALEFFNYLNDLHPNIKFTMEEEKENKLNFLDVTIAKTPQSTTHSVYRKPTTTKLGTSFFSFTPINYKINAIRTLVHRAYHLSSNYSYFHKEIEYLKLFFEKNGYPSGLVEKCVRNFLDKTFQPKNIISTAEKQKLFVEMPFIAKDNSLSQLKRSLNFFYPQIDFSFFFKQNQTIGSCLQSKDRLPEEMRANIIYKYSCDSCQGTYIGSSIKQAKVRFHQHFGLSHRTSYPLTNPVHSNIRNHCLESDHQMKFSNFSVIDQSSSSDLRVLESLYIKKLTPNLNIDQSSHPLLIC